MIGAPGRTRTSTPLRTTDFESVASTNSATGAIKTSCGPRGLSALAPHFRAGKSHRIAGPTGSLYQIMPVELNMMMGRIEKI